MGVPAGNKGGEAGKQTQAGGWMDSSVGRYIFRWSPRCGGRGVDWLVRWGSRWINWLHPSWLPPRGSARRACGLDFIELIRRGEASL